jgi:hypothetical protein
MSFEKVITETLKTINPDYEERVKAAGERLAVARAMITHRLDMGLTREQFAETLGVSLNDLSRLECGDF